MQNNKNILLINQGSPKSLDIKDVRSYLREFLSDDLVIDLPKIIDKQEGYVLFAFYIAYIYWIY